MQFSIASPVVPPLDCFMVEVRTYQGDESGDTVFSVGPFRRDADEASLQSLIETLDRVRDNFRWGNPDRLAHHEDILGFLHWFDSSDYSNMGDLRNDYPELVEMYGVEAHEELARLTDGWYPDWPLDHLRGFGSEGRHALERLGEYEVFYYDADGNKFAVNVQ